MLTSEKPLVEVNEAKVKQLIYKIIVAETLPREETDCPVQYLITEQTETCK